MHRVRIALFVVCTVAVFGNHVTYSQDLDVPTTGEVIGEQIGDAVASVFDNQRIRAEIGAEIQAARQAYLDCYPDCPDIDAKRAAFDKLLTEKDSIFLLESLVRYQDQSLGGRGPSPVDALNRLAGTVDGGIKTFCSVDFDYWTRSIYESIGGGIIVFKANKVVPAIKANSDKYDEYVVCRNENQTPFRRNSRECGAPPQCAGCFGGHKDTALRVRPLRKHDGLDRT